MFYRHLSRSAALLGPWFFALIARGVALGYFVLFPKRVRIGVDFYNALLPGRSGIYYRLCVLRQFQNFTRVFLDRFLLQSGHTFNFTFEGLEHLAAAAARGSGGIIVMSHMGNWELAAHLLHASLPDLPLMLFLGERADDAIERLQSRDLQKGGVRVIGVDRHAATTFTLLPAVEFLRAGGYVSLTGDKLWHSGQRSIAARFIGRIVYLPEAPYVLALVTGAPLFFFFARRKPDGHYHFQTQPPVHLVARNRAERPAVLAQAAQTYAGCMERHLQLAPFEWYHFEPFVTQECIAG